MAEKSEKKSDQKSFQSEQKLSKIVSWAKRRGFVFPSSEIYGGIGGVYDFGPYGVELKNNFKKYWWKKFVSNREDMVGLDAGIIMNAKVWEASGHTSSFSDPLRECKKCHKRFKADDLEGQLCPECGSELAKEKQFNILVKTFLGSTEDKTTQTYLRGETAQGIFVNFKNVTDSTRKKLPFGIAQIGKAFRNEINPKDYLYRTREFEQAEIEYFIKPDKVESEKQYKYWIDKVKEFYLDLGVKEENLEIKPHEQSKLSHYSIGTSDVEYKFPFGTKELAGIAQRTDYDLSQHQKFSGKNMEYFDEETQKKYIPYVVEPSFGVDRGIFAIICDSYEEISGGRSESENPSTSAQDDLQSEVVMHFDPKIAPVKAAVLPLTKKISEGARKVYQDLKSEFGAIEYDEGGSIGRRYRRQDEIGTPYCLTYDFESENDNKVTVRDRDTMKQERIAISDLKNYIKEKIN